MLPFARIAEGVSAPNIQDGPKNKHKSPVKNCNHSFDYRPIHLHEESS
jgi:hypothetical protein